MNIKEKIAKLKFDMHIVQAELALIQEELNRAEGDIQNHIYDSLEEAENFLFSMFENMAHEDCQGTHNCGDEEYTQDFIVGGKEYTAIGSFEYNRHDKTYYYIDSGGYSYKEKQ